jgi:hypothetical protein
MLKRLLARFLIGLQVYACFFQGILYATVYEARQEDYRVSVTAPSAGASDPMFRFKVASAAANTKDLEDIAISSFAASSLELSEKGFTPTTEGLVWDIDGLRFIATASGQLVIKGKSLNPSRKWIIESAASIILDGVSTEYLEITSGLLLTTGKSEIACLKLSGTSETSEWINQGELTAKNLFLHQLWAVNQGKVESGDIDAQTAFGFTNSGELKVTAKVNSSNSYWCNDTAGSMDIAAFTHTGSLYNAGTLSVHAFTTSGEARVQNVGSLQFDSWQGQGVSFINQGTARVEQTTLQLDTILNEKLLQFGTQSVVKTRMFMNKSILDIATLFVAQEAINDGELSFVSLQGQKDSLFKNQRVLKTDAKDATVTDISIENSGSVEASGKVVFKRAALLNKNQYAVAQTELSENSTFDQQGTVSSSKSFTVDESSKLTTTVEQDFKSESLVIKGQGAQELEGDFEVTKFATEKDVTLKGSLTAKESAQVTALIVTLGSKLTTADLKIAKDLQNAGTLIAERASVVDGNITNHVSGNLSLVGFSASLTPKSVANDGSSFISFVPAYQQQSKGLWKVINKGSLTIDQSLMRGSVVNFVTAAAATVRVSALALDIENANAASIRLAKGEFDLRALNNAGVVELEQAYLQVVNSKGVGHFDLIGNYSASLANGVHSLKSSNPLTVSVAADVDLTATLLQSKFAVPHLTVNKTGNWDHARDLEMPVALTVNVIGGHFKPSALLRSKSITLMADDVKTESTAVNLAKVVATEGALSITARNSFENRKGYFFGKSGLTVTAKNIHHGDRRNKNPGEKIKISQTSEVDAPAYMPVAGVELASEGQITLDATSSANANEGDVNIYYGQVVASHQGIVVKAKNKLEVLAGFISAHRDTKVTAKSLVVKRDAATPSACGRHAVTVRGVRSMFAMREEAWTEYFTCQQLGRSVVNCDNPAAYTENSFEGILKVGGNLDLSGVDSTKVETSLVSVNGDLTFKNAQVLRDTMLDRSNPQYGLDVVTRGSNVGKIEVGNRISGAIQGTARSSGSITAADIQLSALQFMLTSTGAVDRSGQPLRLVNLTQTIQDMQRGGHPLLMQRKAAGRSVVAHVAPLSLVQEVVSLPVFGVAEPIADGIHMPAELPTIEWLTRQIMANVSAGVLNFNAPTIRNLTDNALRFAMERQARVRESEARNSQGQLIRFSSAPELTEEDVKEATYALVFSKYRQGVNRAADDAVAQSRLNAASAVSDADRTLSSIAPELESMLMIPARTAPRSSSELIARSGDVRITAPEISATRGREVIREGNAVQGREYERHLDPVLISAPKGKVVLDGEHVGFTDVTPEARDGVVYPNAQPEFSNPALMSRSWDHTAEISEAQRAQMAGMMPGFGSGFGPHMMLPTSCMVHIDNFLNPSGARVSGFTPFTSTQRIEQIANPHLRHAHQKMARVEARADGQWQEFERMANVAKAPNIRAHIVPNGIIDRIETMAFEMQVEWEAKEFEASMEAAVVAAYEDESESSASGAAAASSEPQLKEDDQEVIHKAANAVRAIEKRALKIAKANGDKSTLIEGLWDAETIRARAELEDALRNRNLSAKVREYAGATLEVMGEMADFAKENPTQVAIEIAYMLTPFADAAKTAVFGVRDVIRGNASLAHVALATATSAGAEVAMAGVAGKFVRTGGKVIAAVGNKVASKVYASEFKSLSGKISETPITWTAPTGTGQTYKVWQRTDIDWTHVRTAGDKRYIGKTNAEAARAGFAPQLGDGYLATLHHINQDGLGNLVEASRKYHGFGKDGYSSLHGIWGKSRGHPTNPVDRPKFEKDTEAYWKSRIGGAE